jgi:hypothetical protein
MLEFTDAAATKHYINPQFVAHVTCKQAPGQPAGILNIEIHLAGGSTAHIPFLNQEEIDKFLAEIPKPDKE